MLYDLGNKNKMFPHAKVSENHTQTISAKWYRLIGYRRGLNNEQMSRPSVAFNLEFETLLSITRLTLRCKKKTASGKERKNRVGTRAPASAFLECRRMSSLDRGETWLHKSRIHFKGLWSHPCLSLLGIYACTQFTGQSGIWNGTVVHGTK